MVIGCIVGAGIIGKEAYDTSKIEINKSSYNTKTEAGMEKYLRDISSRDNKVLVNGTLAFLVFTTSLMSYKARREIERIKKSETKYTESNLDDYLKV